MEGMEKTIAEKLIELSSFCSSRKECISCPLYPKCYSSEKICTAFCSMDAKTLDECWEIMNGWIVRDQTAKADAGKPDIYLVPPEIMEAIAVVRQYGNEKYGDPDNWKTVEIERYYSALERHMFAWRKWKETGKEDDQFDQESGIKHLWHAACNIAFMIAMEERKEAQDDANK